MVTDADWIALSALLLTGGAMATGVIYRMGQLVNRVGDLAYRVERIESKLDGKRPGRARERPA